MNHKSALVVGNTDGIGLLFTRRLLDEGLEVIGISKSKSNINDTKYKHLECDVTTEEFLHHLKTISENVPSLIVYCAGIGDQFDIERLAYERKVFDVNLIGVVKSIEQLLPKLIKNKNGHIIVLSSVADEMISEYAPSYSASKQAVTSYVESLALAVRKYNVFVTNVRFGFVDTKMAKGDQKPLMMSVEKAVAHICTCIEKKPIRFTRPRISSLFVLWSRWLVRLKF